MDLPTGLARVVGSLQTIGEVIGAGFEVVDVVIQDEFTHDVVVRHARQGNLYLVFDAT